MTIDLRGFKCKDCRVCTHEVQEYYMVHNAVWREALPDGRQRRGMLCIGCLEARIGRPLVGADFTDAPINRGVFPLSPRILERMAATP